jgi:hypothetical protein
MSAESVLSIFQQIGAILLSIVMSYKFYNWIRKSNSEEGIPYVNLIEARSIRQEAWNRSLEFLSKKKEKYEIL